MRNQRLVRFETVLDDSVVLNVANYGKTMLTIAEETVCGKFTLPLRRRNNGLLNEIAECFFLAQPTCFINHMLHLNVLPMHLPLPVKAGLEFIEQLDQSSGSS